MFKTALIGVFTYAIISINLSVAAETISAISALTSIIMTTVAAIAVAYFND